MKRIAVIVMAVICMNSGFGQATLSFNTNDYIHALKSATDIMVNDVTSPAAASRYYAYINLAANETVALFEKDQPHFSGFLKGLDELKLDDGLIGKSDPSLAPILALYKCGLRLLPSGYLLQENIDSLKRVAKRAKFSDEKVNSTMQLVDKLVDHIIAYSRADGFMKLSGYRRFTPQRGDQYWQPTPPGFMQAIEPNWNTLRPFFLDSSSQFATLPPHEYNPDTSSGFYKELKEVYDVGKRRSPEETEIAMFWDCNPYALQQLGHLEFGIKKISPGGHWMGITGIACKKKKLRLDETAYAHALVSMGIADAFISSWNDKYTYDRVRPVTAIRKIMDPGWLPLLQTPPFPEYTSAHSVISTAASTILTHLFGDHFSFTDDSEKEFGLPPRKFTSFRMASDEAGISRLYGGIHYRDAVVNGISEGEQIGKYVVANSPDSKAKDGDSARAISAHSKN